MKKLFGLFFLFNFLYVPIAFAQADSVALHTDAGFTTTRVLGDLPLSKYFTFDFEGNYIFDQNSSGVEKIVKIKPSGESSVLVDQVRQPLLGLSFNQGKVYAIFRGRIDVVNRGSFTDVVAGLPAMGDYPNSPIIFQDGKMYFSVGTATNSGFVGADNSWLKNQPSVHDLLCLGLKTNQVNLESDNFLTAKNDDKAVTGAFMPFNTKSYTDTIAASGKCNGSVMRSNPDGSALEVVASGFHNLKGISFDAKGNLYGLDSAMEERGERPIKDGKDSLFAISKGNWYGWPDFTAGKQVENPVIKEYPSTPPKPLAIFEPSHLSQFIMNKFGTGSGLAVVDNNKLVEFNLNSGKLNDFATLSEGQAVNQIKFGPDENLYILLSNNKHSELWRVESTKHSTGGLTTSGNRNIPIAWSISLSVMTIGLIGTYLVYKNRQEPIL